MPRAGTRLLLALLYIANPSAGFAATVMTYSQWRLSLLALLILLSRPPRSKAGSVLDFLTLFVSGLSGPYSLLMMPVAAIHAVRRYSRRTLALAMVVMVTAAAQVHTIYTIGMQSRAAPPHGASVYLLLQILGARLFYNSFLGPSIQVVPPPLFQSFFGTDPCVAAAGILCLCLLAVAFFRGTHELRMLLLFSGAIIGSILISASVPMNYLPQWVVLRNPLALPTYFVIPITAMYAAMVWMLAARPRVLGLVAGALLLSTVFYAVPQNWRSAPVEDRNFPDVLRRYEAAQPGEMIEMIVPPDWRIPLQKHAPK